MFKFLNPVWLIENFLTLSFGGSSAPTPTNTTVQNTNIPDYAQPYVMNMLGATESQLFNTDSSGNITGFNQYQPYSTNPQDYVAGFSPLQQQAQNSAAYMQTPGQFGQASGLAGMSGMRSMGIANQAANAGNQYNQMATNPYAVGAFMNPYVQESLQPQLNQLAQQGNIASTQAASQATGSGAFGGTRSALAQNLAQQNALMAQQQAIGQGYNTAYNNAQNAMQYGAGLGLQGQQAALTGMGQANTAASNLANIGTQQQAAQQGIINTQNTLGAQQQQNQQNVINQAVQNYANAQQYPMMELGMMSNMLRGLPMQGMTTQQYQAQPSMTNQLVGLTGALASTPATKTSKKGGILEADDVKRYNVGNAVKANIASLTTPQLQQALQTAASTIEKGDIQAELANRAQGSSPTIAAANGGILSFEEGSKGTVGDDAEAAQIAADRAAIRSGVTTAAKAASQPSGIPIDLYGLGEKIADYGTAGINRLGKALGIVEPGTSSLKMAPAQPASPGGYTPTAAEAAPPSATQVAATKLAMQGNQQQQPPAAAPQPAPAPKANIPAGVLGADSLHRPSMDEMLANARKELTPDELAIQSGKTKVGDIDSYIQQVKADQDKYIDPEIIKARQEDRRRAMQSKDEITAQLADRNAREQQNMWLRIGSTPGPLLAALTKSWAEKNLADVQNTEWGRNAMSKADDLIAKFNDSDYLIQQGQVAKGYDLHEQAVKDLQKASSDVEAKLNRNLTTQATMYGHDVTRADAQARNKTEQARLDIEKTKAAATPSKEDILIQGKVNDRFKSVYEPLVKQGVDPDVAEKKANASALALLTPAQRKKLGYDDVDPDTSRGKVLSKDGKPV